MTNILLNKKQRERELAVASRVTDLMVANTRSATEMIPQSVLAHFFGLGCAELDFIPDDGSARRILHACAGQLKERRRVADRLNEHILTSTEELIEMQQAAKRARR